MFNQIKVMLNKTTILKVAVSFILTLYCSYSLLQSEFDKVVVLIVSLAILFSVFNLEKNTANKGQKPEKENKKVSEQINYSDPYSIPTPEIEMPQIGKAINFAEELSRKTNTVTQDTIGHTKKVKNLCQELTQDNSTEEKAKITWKIISSTKRYLKDVTHTVKN